MSMYDTKQLGLWHSIVSGHVERQARSSKEIQKSRPNRARRRLLQIFPPLLTEAVMTTLPCTPLSEGNAKW